MRELAAALVLLVLIALFARALMPDPEERKRKDALDEAARRKLERKRKEAVERMEREGIRHLFKRSFYKPSAAYLAPAKPELKPAANVRQIRSKR